MQKENIYIDIKVSFRNRFLVEEPFDWESQAALKFVPEALLCTLKFQESSLSRSKFCQIEIIRDHYLFLLF